jgi:hypothetical protein
MDSVPAMGRRKRRKQWSDLTTTQQALVVAGSAVEIALTTIALADLARRPRAQVRGPRWAWGLALTVQPVGPVAYLLVGRRR